MPLRLRSDEAPGAKRCCHTPDSPTGLSHGGPLLARAPRLALHFAANARDVPCWHTPHSVLSAPPPEPDASTTSSKGRKTNFSTSCHWPSRSL